MIRLIKTPIEIAALTVAMTLILVGEALVMLGERLSDLERR